MPCMRECYQQSTLVEFYTENKMVDLLNNLKMEVEGEAERVEQLLVTKLVAVRVMEGLLQVPKTDLSESLELQRKKVMSFIYSSILKSNLRFIQSDYCSYLNRQLHATAYVATCVWICNTDLFSSSLADDVTRHDFTSSKLVPSPLTSGNNVALSLELDEINVSEPMQVLTALFHQMSDRGFMSQSGDETVGGPSWLEAFISCLDSPGQERNVRVWLIKLVVNCGHLLAGFAARLYPVLVRVITAGTLGSQINYFLNDVLLVLLRWHITALPQPDTAQELLSFLFGLTHHSNDAIVKYNLELIRLVG
ncbi:hypothetical protein WDU94_010182 [Cyamophila willieti]